MPENNFIFSSQDCSHQEVVEVCHLSVKASSHKLIQVCISQGRRHLPDSSPKSQVPSKECASVGMALGLVSSVSEAKQSFWPVPGRQPTALALLPSRLVPRKGHLRCKTPRDPCQPEFLPINYTVEHGTIQGHSLVFHTERSKFTPGTDPCIYQGIWKTTEESCKKHHTSIFHRSQPCFASATGYNEGLFTMTRSLLGAVEL